MQDMAVPGTISGVGESVAARQVLVHSTHDLGQGAEMKSEGTALLKQQYRPSRSVRGSFGRYRVLETGSHPSTFMIQGRIPRTVGLRGCERHAPIT